MRGRMLHDEGGQLEFLRYGMREGEVIHAVSRETLNRMLIEAAAEHRGIELRVPGALPRRRSTLAHSDAARRAHRQVRSGALRASAGRRRRRLGGTPCTAGPWLHERDRGAAAARLQGAAPARDRRRLRLRAARAAHLAARRLHADRAAKSRQQLHRDAVPAASRRAELRIARPQRAPCRRCSRSSSPMPQSGSPI